MQVSNTYREVFEALDASASALTCLPRSEAVVRRACYQFDRIGDRAAVSDLRRISIALQVLASATRIGDQHQRIVIATQLKAAGRCWMERLPIH